MAESTNQHFEWHRERALREKRETNEYSVNRLSWLTRETEKKHGKKAADEIVKEVTSKEKSKKRMYFT